MLLKGTKAALTGFVFSKFLVGFKLNENTSQNCRL